MNSTQSTYIIAGAIVFAGIVIAGGVFLASSPANNPQNPTTADPSNNQQQEGSVDLAELASDVGVDQTEFQACLDEQRFSDTVEAEFNNAQDAGGRGTPYSVLVLDDPLSESARNQVASENITVSDDGMRIGVSGALPFNSMSQLLDMMLNDPEAGSDVATSDDVAITPVSSEDHIRGNEDASIVVVEYSDIDCPFCARFHDTMRQVTDEYDSNEVAWVFRHFPLAQLHPDAPRKAMASECVADLGGEDAFWSFVDELLASA